VIAETWQAGCGSTSLSFQSIDLYNFYFDGRRASGRCAAAND
jgi:hypothetical protein